MGLIKHPKFHTPRCLFVVLHLRPQLVVVVPVDRRPWSQRRREMDKAIVPRIGAVDDDYKLPLWASSVGLRVEVVERLVAAYRDLHSVLTEAQEREIQNPELVRHLREEAEHKADRAEDLLGELEYYRIQGEVEQDEHHHHDDDDSKVSS